MALSHSERETAALAETLAGTIRPGDVVFLLGDLGAGKTVFARALIRFLCGDPDMDVPSPTFTLVQTYDTPRGPVYHFDLYRIEREEDIYELGWDDALAGGIVIVEWPERLGFLTPEDRLDIKFSIGADDSQRRDIALIPCGNWPERIDDA